jgi:hypothetical protein
MRELPPALAEGGTVPFLWETNWSGTAVTDSAKSETAKTEMIFI